MALTEAYKRRNSIKSSEETKFHQCKFIPKNPEKVVGGEILCRSSWETKLADWCDRNPAVIKWGSEVISIAYRNPIAANINELHKYHLDITNPINWPVNNYYPDFYMQIQNQDGSVKTLLIEVKPYAQTQPPKQISENAKLKDIRAFNNQAKTYIQNDAKWKAAREWCKLHNIEFVVFTEHELKRMGLL